MRRLVPLLALLGLLVLPAPALAGTFERRTFTSEHGTRAYSLFVPTGYAGQRVPLVVMLHGCTQDAADFARGTRMNALAERDTFLVAYPEQDPAANTSRCWNWFEPAHQRRGGGEPAVIAGIAQALAREFSVAERRVHLAGLSAGGAMSVVVGATYPDVFASIGVAAGLEYQAATDLASALAAQQVGGPDPDRQGRLAWLAAGAAERPVPAIVFHGDLDVTVAPVNGEQVIAQWAQTGDLADDGRDDGSVDARPETVSAGTAPGGRAFTQSVFADRKGAPLLEHWVVHGMRHAWSGGSAEGSYTDPAGPDASAELLRFFAAHPRR